MCLYATNQVKSRSVAPRPSALCPLSAHLPSRPSPRLPTTPLARLSKVQEMAGSGAPAPDLVDAMLEGEFDPEEWDRRMEQAFGEDYYEVGGRALGWF